MPEYEYRCMQCGQRSSHLFLSFASVTEPNCPHCDSSDMRRLVSRFAVMKSEEARLESLSDPSMFAGVDENDPRSVAQWARKLGSQLGDDLPADYDEMVDQIESGEMPDDLAGGPADTDASLDAGLDD